MLTIQGDVYFYAVLFAIQGAIICFILSLIIADRLSKSVEEESCRRTCLCVWNVFTNAPVGEGQSRPRLWLVAWASCRFVIGCWPSPAGTVETEQRFDHVSEERFVRRTKSKLKDKWFSSNKCFGVFLGGIVSKAACGGEAHYRPLSVCWGAEGVPSMHPASSASTGLIPITRLKCQTSKQEKFKKPPLEALIKQ